MDLVLCFEIFLKDCYFLIYYTDMEHSFKYITKMVIFFQSYKVEETVELKCKVTGEPLPAIKWFK